MSTSFDTVIVNGLIVDGTGAPGSRGDLGIIDGRVAAIGDLGDATAERRIDAEGRIVAPGHITQHTHYDAALFWDPYASNSGENGVTTVVNSNCGFGFAPVRPEDRERTMAMMSTTEQIPVEHQRAAMPWDWETFPEWMDRIRALPLGVNVSTFLPLNPLLVYVMGVDAAKSRRPTDAEMAEMHRLINEAMDAGAIGISMSVMGAEGNSHVDFDGTSMPTDAMDHDTMLELGQAVVERGDGVIQMISQIAVFGDRQITERMADLAAGTRVRVVHNVFLTSDPLAHMVPEDLGWLDEQRALGRDLTVGALVNRGWVEVGVRELDTAAGQLQGVRRIVGAANDTERLALLGDPGFVAAFADEYGGAMAATGASAFEGQTVIDVGDRPELAHLVGRTLGQIAEDSDRDVVAVLCDLGVRTELELQLKSPPIGATGPEQAVTLLRHSAVVGGGSDGGAHTKAFSMGQYATDLLMWLVRDEGLMTVEDMHFQLALKPARSVQILDRGALLPGYWADVLIYGLDELYFDMTRYEMVHDMPNGDWRRRGNAGGYRYILVNGVVTHDRDATTGETPGHFVDGATTAALSS
ncbi:MAG: amidohydrolase family protein [Actinomycetota bacterium]